MICFHLSQNRAGFPGKPVLFTAWPANESHTHCHTFSHKHALRPLNGYLVSGRCYFVNERFELYIVAWGGKLIINTFCERYQKHVDSGT